MPDHLNYVLAREILAVIDIMSTLHGSVKEGRGVFLIEVPEEVRIRWSFSEGLTARIFTYSLEVKVPADWVEDLGFDLLTLSSDSESEERVVWAFREGKPVAVGQLQTYQITWSIPNLL